MNRTPHETAAAVAHTGRVIVSLAREAIDLVRAWASHDDQRPLGTLHDFAEHFSFSALLGVLPPEAQVPTRPLVRSVLPARVLALEDAALAGSSELLSLTLYWKLDTRALSPTERGKLVDRLREVPEVRGAYQEIGYAPAAVPVNLNPQLPQQGYLDSAPEGIGARLVWYRYDGTGIGFGDVENQWNTSHVDLDRVNAVPPLSAFVRHGINWDTTWRDHGTAVLGIVLGVDNNHGIMGMAPLTGTAMLFSNYDGVNADPNDLTNALVTAASQLAAGDVLLIEDQTSDHYPVEVDVPVFQAIRVLTGNGIVVVEPAGNRKQSLDAGSATWGSYYPNPPIDRMPNLVRGSTDLDSGAILVGASRSIVTAGGHAPWSSGTSGSNVGNRLDCYAWGDSVWTSGNWGGVVANEAAAIATLSATHKNFTGTSAASAIIAGAAILTQQMSDQTSSIRLTPHQMRAVLSDPLSGTPQDQLGSGLIGVMPNLFRIGQRVGAIPDLSLLGRVRKLPNDKWFDPAVRFRCPGLIVVWPLVGVLGPPDPEPDPRLLTQRALRDVASVFVQIHNRGRYQVDGVRATTYSAEAGPLAAPSLWTLIGEASPVSIPANTSVVVGPIPWPGMPDGGHASLVAVVSHPEDPALIGPDTGWNDFVRLLPQDDNVAWKNVAYVHATGGRPGVVPLPGVVVRSGDARARQFTLRLAHDLPSHAQLRVDSGPLGDVDPVIRGGWSVRSAEAEIAGPIPLDLSLQLRAGAPAGNYTIVLGQLFQEVLVGEFSWSIRID